MKLYVTPRRGVKVPVWFGVGFVATLAAIGVVLLVMATRPPASSTLAPVSVTPVTAATVTVPATSAATAPAVAAAAAAAPTTEYRPTLMEIPNVIGKDPDFAQALLHQAGFKTTVETDGKYMGYYDSSCWVRFENRHAGDPIPTSQTDMGVIGYGSTIPLIVFCD